MIWTTMIKKGIGSSEMIEWPIPEYHSWSGDVCETFGACAIAEANEILRMALEIFVDGRTNVVVRSRHLSFGGFYSLSEEDLEKPWI